MQCNLLGYVSFTIKVCLNQSTGSYLNSKIMYVTNDRMTIVGYFSLYFLFDPSFEDF